MRIFFREVFTQQILSEEISSLCKMKQAELFAQFLSQIFPSFFNQVKITKELVSLPIEVDHEALESNEVLHNVLS